MNNNMKKKYTYIIGLDHFNQRMRSFRSRLDRIGGMPLIGWEYFLNWIDKNACICDDTVVIEVDEFDRKAFEEIFNQANNHKSRT